ncbi:MAG: N-6 DNA Methylase [Candidatus Argoarchaeum ethanivorans]|uniref:site-specific DNA-methyltransferase (adenine-specific) n=1 Tax=Candidatus Argoarchaeum ethanivorans TaxID=2608793 RepID=A0A811TBD6_9EURY|nr:MAG: N-6 DNA Methylase [Candidatus Argoarchaeum ethanivorans]
MKDKRHAIQLLDETFNCDFDNNKFSNFIKELFNQFNVFPNTWDFGGEYKGYIDSCQILGTYKDSSRKIIDVLVVKLQKGTVYKDRARTKQRNLIAKYLGRANKDAALVAFYGDDPQDWRFSFVKMDYSFTKDGSIVKELTPAKRYSYLVGVNEPNHTCRRQFLDLVIEEDTNPSLKDIENAFSIDNVTKVFFSEYKKLFLELKESLDRIIGKHLDVKEEFDQKSISTVDFSKKLLGQIVFIYFLQKKGWLGVSKNKETGKFKEWGDGPKKFLRKLFDKEIIGYDEFFNEILEPLFYEALSKEYDHNFYSRFDCKIPFLNGGLFEPINDYDWVNVKIPFENKIFKDILKIFDRFNFTVKEDEPLDKEVAVDPEMLGKVFENLLDVTDRKSRGAFYTPREIVHYMCQQSLINYLETNTDVPVGDIETFIQHGEFAQQITSRANVDEKYIPASIKNNRDKIDNLLKNIKIVDPAVGSGAFPMGMMNEIVKARSILSYLRKDVKNNYDLKRETIENCLYGVDIDSSAVDITKLRFWLSLVVDEIDIKKIKPLPNLDHKIMCGNSLLEEFEGVKLFDERLLERIPETSDFELEWVNADVEKLYTELGEIHTGKRKDNGRKKEIETELKKLDRRKKAIVSRPEDETRQSTFDSVLENRKKESQKKLAELKQLQKNFFNEQDRKRKKELAEDIDRIEWELVEETLKEQGNEDAMQKLAQYEKNKSKPFFLWKLYFSEVFQGENPGFDVVIANPPYKVLGSEDELLDIYKKTYGVCKGGKINLYKLFYEEGLIILKNKGCLTFISPDNYLTSADSVALRELFINQTKIIEIIDYSESDKIFDSVTQAVATIVLVKENAKENHIFNYTKLGEEYDISYKDVMNHDKYFIKGLNEVIKKISAKKNKFGDFVDGWQGEINVSTKKDFFTEVYTEDSLPLVRGTNIGAYCLISVPKEFCPTTVSNRNHHAQERIVFQEVSNAGLQRRIKSTILNNFLCGHTTNYMIPINSNLNIKFIIAILNSCVFNYYFKFFNQTNHVPIGEIKKIPVFDLSKVLQKPFIYLVDQILAITKDPDYPENPSKQSQVKTLENQIDQLVYKLYDLTPEEITIVENFNKGK